MKKSHLVQAHQWHPHPFQLLSFAFIASLSEALKSSVIAILSYFLYNCIVSGISVIIPYKPICINLSNSFSSFTVQTTVLLRGKLKFLLFITLLLTINII